MGSAAGQLDLDGKSVSSRVVIVKYKFTNGILIYQRGIHHHLGNNMCFYKMDKRVVHVAA